MRSMRSEVYSQMFDEIKMRCLDEAFLPEAFLPKWLEIRFNLAFEGGPLGSVFVAI